MRNGEEPPVQWLSAGQLREWASLMGLVVMLPARLDAQLSRDAGLNLFEYHILVELAEAPERRRAMSELALYAHGSLSRLSHAVSRLEAAGWLKRHSRRGAGRRTEVELTDAGMAKLEQSAPGHVSEARRQVIDVLSDTELAALGHAARRIVAALDPAVAATLEPSGPDVHGSAPHMEIGT
ncbi:MarR family transcriptional regulator [Mycolicibacterium sp. BiH015]|uniref:MarR family winged helix-turn-helix transcriptional regulator n=1 Tax=Mycolicibacterium sp. BiH015 TaxID=3018808 RepID=UPI0022E4B207|nr:MarR family transcriptional regulator [Mycolicibacterium sp. BiH015]MDA2890609.1 MarR family transcriptional regulator [Mycolicibacterium sp. BiH015]